VAGLPTPVCFDGEAVGVGGFDCDAVAVFVRERLAVAVNDTEDDREIGDVTDGDADTGDVDGVLDSDREDEKDAVSMTSPPHRP
jgi:hypothetical protein